VRTRTQFGAFVAVLVCLNPLAAEEADLSVRVSLCVSEGAGVPARTLRKAQAEVVRIYRQAGVTVHWTECPPEDRPPAVACRRGAGRPELTLSLEVCPPKDRSRRGIPMGHAWLSDADGEPGCLASVYATSVQQVSRWPLSDSGILLGHAVAHELGHLLLGTREHSHVGLMRHHWRREELERAHQHNLFFLPHEAARLRQAVVIRATR
jgi:hypothetical protein